MSQSRFGLTIIIIFSILILILIFVIIILLCILLRGKRRSLSPSDQLSNIHHRSPIISHHPTSITSKPSNLFSYVKYESMSNENTNSKQALSSTSNIPLTSLEQTSTHSMVGTTTTTTGTTSSNQELEPGTWTEDDPMLHCSASTSNDDDDEEHEVVSNDNDESRQQHEIHMIQGPPTIIYV
jgi:hypothetical protein